LQGANNTNINALNQTILSLGNTQKTIVGNIKDRKLQMKVVNGVQM